MKRALLYILLICLCSTAGGQTIKDLNKAARDNSGKKPQLGGSQYAGSNDAFAAYMLVRSFIWMGQGMLQLGKEQSRLAKRNKEENHLYSLEIRPQAGYGLRSFVRLQPQARANLGCFSVDLKQTILQDANAEFKTLGLMFWMNFWNRGRFRLRGGAGSLGINTSGETFFQYGWVLNFIPVQKSGWNWKQVRPSEFTEQKPGHSGTLISKFITIFGPKESFRLLCLAVHAASSFTTG